MLEICICSHSPKSVLFSRVVEALARQTNTAFKVLIVDSGSLNPIFDEVLRPLTERGISARVVREEIPGLTRARLRAISETISAWVLFCDDDNVLLSNYVEEGMAFIRTNPEVACFGGRQLLPDEINCPRWAKPFLPYLAIRDIGNIPKSSISDRWREWEPAGAGAFVCRALLERFAEIVKISPNAMILGRSPDALHSCDDSLMMRGAFYLGRPTAYNPRLSLYHHIDPARFRFSYLSALFKGYGISHVMLETILQGPQKAPPHLSSWWNLLMFLGVEFFSLLKRTSWRFAVAMCIYHYSSFRTFRKLNAMPSAAENA